METIQENNALVQIIETSGLEKTKAQVLLEKFTSYFEIAADWEKKIKMLEITDVSQKAEMKMAREGRLFLKEKRVQIGKVHKELKEASLREGQTLDAIKKILTNLIEPLEEQLEQKEKYAELQEAKRIEALKSDRFAELSKYGFQFENGFDLGRMDQAMFESLLLGTKTAYEKSIEDAKKAEEERIAKEKAEAEERERIKKENEALKAQAEEREKAMAEERAKAAAAQKAIEEKAAKEKAAAEAQAKKVKAEHEAKLKKEAEEREKVEAELRAKKESEAKAKQEEEARIEAELNKGDKDKFNSMMQDLEMLKYKYKFSSAKYKKLQTSVNELLDKTINYGLTKV